MLPSEIELCHGTQFSIVCRVRHPVQRTANNGTLYLSFTIEDYITTIKAYAWHWHDLNLQDLDKVAVNGRIREFNGDWIADVTSIQQCEVSPKLALKLIPVSLCPNVALVNRLRNVVSWISNQALLDFVEETLSDDGFLLPFISLPASRKHHHSTDNGLLIHCLECTEMVARFADEFGPDLCELAVVGALFHDAGKTMTLNIAGSFSTTGCVLNHDALTLEVLAPHLKKLENVNADLAIALRYLWTWQLQKRGYTHPVLTIAEVIAVADRVSSALDVEESVFEGCPEWQRFGRYETGNTLYWRPRISMMT